MVIAGIYFLEDYKALIRFALLIFFEVIGEHLPHLLLQFGLLHEERIRKNKVR